MIDDEVRPPALIRTAMLFGAEQSAPGNGNTRPMPWLTGVTFGNEMDVVGARPQTSSGLKSTEYGSGEGSAGAHVMELLGPTAASLPTRIECDGASWNETWKYHTPF